MKTKAEKDYDAALAATVANLHNPHGDPAETRRLNRVRARALAKIRKGGK